MLYLETFEFPSVEDEFEFLLRESEKTKYTCYDSYYPFKVLSEKDFERIDFEPITILYGGNGSGKSTALNIVAEKLRLERESPFNRTAFFDDYVQHLCQFKLDRQLAPGSRILTSDDVFDYMLNIRALNEGIDHKREELFSEYTDLKYADFRFCSLDDYEQLKKINDSRRRSKSQFVRKNLMDNTKEFSNGESALMYFSEKITENALYLLDEPENSLSAGNQLKLKEFLEVSARSFGCQFVISTHSPFLLAMDGAKIYDLDEEIVDVKKWTELETIRTYYEFFMEHQDSFSEDL